MSNGGKKKKNTCKYTESEILDNFSGYVYTRGYFSGFINVSRSICINMKKVEEGTMSKIVAFFQHAMQS